MALLVFVVVYVASDEGWLCSLISLLLLNSIVIWLRFSACHVFCCHSSMYVISKVLKEICLKYSPPAGKLLSPVLRKDSSLIYSII